MVEVVREIDLAVAQDREALLQLMNAYACDPMGGGTPLSQAVLDSASAVTTSASSPTSMMSPPGW